jgi:hypothetical protein
VDAFRQYQTPMEEQYHPELDDSDLLPAKECSLYRGLIGSANLMITLGRFDIHNAVNTLSCFSMTPRQTHRQAMIRVFGYLRKFPNEQITVDPTTESRIHLPAKIDSHIWQEFYPQAIEEIPSNIPEPLGMNPTTLAYVDADHAHDQITR